MDHNPELVAALDLLLEKTKAVYEKSNKTNKMAGLLIGVGFTMRGIVRTNDTDLARMVHRAMSTIIDVGLAK